MNRQLARHIPNFLKPILKKVCYFPIDIIDRWKARNGMMPPKSMQYSSVMETLNKQDEYFRSILLNWRTFSRTAAFWTSGAESDALAIPLTDYLSAEGEYWGFDIVKKGIAWRQSRISPRSGNFHFLHSDVYNKHYNPNGKVRARDFEFPFSDEVFDFVFLTSVFTHMLPSDMENYLNEISRVLKAEGRCLITFFLMNEESESLVRSGRSKRDFRYKMQDCLAISEDIL